MSFIKTGDSMPVLNIYDSGGEKCVCEKCGEALCVIAIDESENTLMCKKCDVEDFDN